MTIAPSGTVFVCVLFSAALLAGCGEPEAGSPDLDRTIEDARSSDPHVRRRGVQLLNTWFGEKAARAVPVLAGALRDTDEDVVRHAATALRKIGRPARGTAPRLVEAMLRVRDPHAVSACALALRELAVDSHLCVPAIQKVLRDGSLEPSTALLVLAAFGPDSQPAVPEMIAHVGGEHTEAALLALGSVGSDAAVAIPRITATLESAPTSKVRSLARLALVGIGKPAVPYLTKRIEGHGGVEDIEAIGEIGPDAREALPVLVRVLDDRGRSHDAWEEAAWALMRIAAGEQADPIIVAALERAAARGVRRAQEAVATLSEPAGNGK